MSDVVYSVEVQFLQSGNFRAPAAGISDLHDKTDKWVKSLYGGASGFAKEFNGALDSVGAAFLGLGVKAAAGLSTALSVGMGAAVKMAFDFNEQMETTTISLAAIANSNGLVDNMGNGMRIAGEVIKDMRLDAAKLPGEFKDLEGIMSSIAGPLAQMGVGLFPAEKLAAKTMTAAAVLKVPQDVAGREMASILEGSARHSMPLFRKLGLGDAKAFNALAPDARLAKVRESLDKLNPAVDRFTNSWQGIKTTALDAIRQGVGVVGGPLFNSVKEMVKSFNIRALSKSDDWRHIGEVVGNGLDKAFHQAVDAVKHWYPVVETFAKTMYEHLRGVWAKIGPVIHQALGKLEEFMTDPMAFNKLIRAGEMFLGARAAMGVAEKGFGIAGSLGQGLGAIGGSGGAAAGLEAVGVAAGPVALAIGALAAGVYGAIDIITDSTAPFHDWAADTMSVVGFMMKDVGHQLMEFGGHLKPLAQILGADLIGVLAIVVTAMDMFATVTNKVITGFEWLLHAINDATNALLGIRKPLGKDDPLDPARLAQEVRAVLPFLADGKAEKEKDRIPNHVTNIHKVEIKVNSNQDPNRIAKLTADIVSDLARHPKVATLTGAPIYSR